MKSRELTITEVCDLDEDSVVHVDDFFESPLDEILETRVKIEERIVAGNPKFVCTFCGNPLVLRGGKGKNMRRPHFAHKKDSPDCPIKTYSGLSKDEVNRRKYNGAKESQMHHKLKHEIAHYLGLNPSTNGMVSDVNVEKIIKGQDLRTWRRPDISCIFNGCMIAIELQLSTTFLTTIIERQQFYAKNDMNILWVFSNFSERSDRRFTDSDVFYSNNRNAFVFNAECKRRSEEAQNLVLEVHYLKPFASDCTFANEWHTNYVTINDLTLNKNDHKIFFYDYEKARADSVLELGSTILQAVLRGHRNSVYEAYLSYKDGFNSLEKEWLKNLYKAHVEIKSVIKKGSLEYRIILSLLLLKLNNKAIVQTLIRDSQLERTLLDILSLKIGKIICYNFKNQIQVVHNLLDKRPYHAKLYWLACEQLKSQGETIKNNVNAWTKLQRIAKANDANAQHVRLVEKIIGVQPN